MNSLLRASCSGLMFHPPPRRPLKDFRQDERNILVRSYSRGDIHCQLSYPRDVPTSFQDYKGTAALVILMHGNADDVDSSKSYCEWLADELAANVLSFDYPGYGFSSGDDGSACEEGMVEAAECALEVATHKLKCDVADVIIFGKSIGSFPAVSIASRSYYSRLKGLILVSPVASAARCVLDMRYVPKFLLNRLDSVALDNMSNMHKVQCLVLFVHGRQDTVVTCDNSEDLKVATNYHSQYPALFVRANHNDIECKHKALFLTTLRDFMQACTARGETAFSV
jgi:fermentation-respiration switch protein FrsA (DUF1100 family)